MIRSFRSKALQNLWAGRNARISPEMVPRLMRRLKALDIAEKPGDMALPGFNYHPLRGFSPTRYSVHVNGPWTVTFAFDDGDAVDVDFEQYH